MSDITIVDNSILTSVATCPTQAAVRYVLGLTVPEDRAFLHAGHAAHAVLAAHLSGKGADEALEVQEILDYLVWSTGALPEDDRLYHTNVTKVLRRWVDTHPLGGLPFQVPDPNLVEVGFAVPLADDIIFVGRMDALAQDGSGAWWVVEHKTTGRMDWTWRRRYQTSGQITGYTWAAQQHLSQPVAGCFVNGIEFAKLPTDVRKCRTHGVPYAECGPTHAKFDMLIEHRAPHQLEAWRQDAIRLARRFQSLKQQVQSLDDIANVPMFGQLTGACTMCQFADWCRVGRPVSTGSSMFEYDMWEPYKHALAGGPDGGGSESTGSA